MGFTLHKIKKNIDIIGFYTAFESYYKRDYSFDGEAHDFWELMYIKKGKARVSADERIYELGAGEMIFHKPMEFHKFTKLGEDEFSYFVMSFAVKGDGMKFFENGVFVLTREQQYAFGNLMDFMREHEDPYKGALSISYLEGNVPSEHLSILKNMTELFLMRDMKNTIKPKHSLSTTEALIFRDAVNMMHNNINLSLSAEDFASACNVSLSYMKKIFKKHTGIGIHEYFLKLKITEATKLLKEGKTVTETAELLNFSSQNYFSTVYKKIRGVSPNKVKL